MPSKVVLFFNQDQQGWTETYYTNAVLTYQSFNTPPWVNFFQKSMAMRGPGCYLYGARWTDEAATRVNYSQVFDFAYVSVASSGPEVTAVDACLKLLTVNEYSRHLFLRGLYQPWVIRSPVNGAPSPAPALLLAITNYIIAMNQLGLCVKIVENPAVFPGLPNAQVLQVVPNPANGEQSILTLSQALGIATPPAAKVHFGRIPRNDLPGFPAACVLANQIAGPPPTIIVPWRYRASTPTYTPQAMHVYASVFNYVQIAAPSAISPTWQLVSFQERKTGRAFGVPRGRARVALTRR